MGFFAAIRTCIGKFATFRGRASRPEFWWWTLFVSAVGAVLVVVLPGSVYRVGLHGTTTIGTPPSLVALQVWLLITLVPSLAVAVRRLRDAGKHWALLFLGLIPVLGTAVLIFLFAMPAAPGARDSEGNLVNLPQAPGQPG